MPGHNIQQASAINAANETFNRHQQRQQSVETVAGHTVADCVGLRHEI